MLTIYQNFSHYGKKLIKVIILSSAITSLVGCTQDKKTIGTLGGAAIGGAVTGLISDGNPIVTIAGVVGGGLIGNAMTKDNKSSKK
jgi:osmotically inducible lipoprotein OsmB